MPPLLLRGEDAMKLHLDTLLDCANLRAGITAPLRPPLPSLGVGHKQSWKVC